MVVFWPAGSGLHFETFYEARNALGVPCWERLSEGGCSWGPLVSVYSVIPGHVVSMAARLMARWMTHRDIPTEHAPTTEQAPSGALHIKFPLVPAVSPEALSPQEFQFVMPAASPNNTASP